MFGKFSWDSRAISSGLASNAVESTPLFGAPIALRGYQKIALWVSLIALAICLMRLYHAEVQYRASIPESTDFYKFYLSAQRVRQGESMYWRMPARLSTSDPCFRGGSGKPNAGQGPLCLHPNLNPPFFNMLGGPLMRLNYSVAWWAWSLGSMFCGIFSLWLIARTCVTRPKNVPLVTTASACALFLYFPTFANFQYGQVTMLLLLPLSLGWRAMRTGRNVTAGAWLGLAASLKPFFGIFLIVFLITKNKRAAASFLFVGFSACVFAACVYGIGSYIDYLAVGRDVTWFSASWNTSFLGFFTRIFGGSENEPWILLPMVATSMAAILSVGVLLILSLVMARSRNCSRIDAVDILFLLAVPAMLLISPLGWLYYFPLLCVNVPILWRVSLKIPNGRAYILMLGVAFALTAIPRDLLTSATMNSPFSWFWEAAGFHYALLVVFASSVHASFALVKGPRECE